MNMSEEEDCDDLPPITVNISANNSSTFAMPSAEEMAEQRARELECERQLELLRQRARDDERAAAPGRAAEGELELAAYVTRLSVDAARPAAALAGPAAAALWAALAPLLPPPAAALLAWLGAPAVRLRAQLARAVAALGGALAAEAGAWPDAELLSAAALLSVAALAHESRERRAAARALHALLDDHATSDQVCMVVDVVLEALPDARTRLQLSDALRSGGGAGADWAAAALTGAAVLRLLRAAPARPPLVAHVARAAAAWRACGPQERAHCVQAAGRLLAAGAPPDACERLLAQLALPPAPASDAHRPDRLKALVGVSKLKLLFSAKNGVSGQPRPQRDTST